MHHIQFRTSSSEGSLDSRTGGGASFQYWFPTSPWSHHSLSPPPPVLHPPGGRVKSSPGSQNFSSQLK